jgi:Na+/H+-dicarboxylate symporter
MRPLGNAFIKLIKMVIALAIFCTVVSGISGMADMKKVGRVGRYGISSLGPLALLIAAFYLTSILFVVGLLGAIAWWSGFNIFRFLAYIKEEILIVLGTSSSDSALPSLMEKLGRLGCSKPVVGLVVPMWRPRDRTKGRLKPWRVQQFVGLQLGEL